MAKILTKEDRAALEAKKGARGATIEEQICDFLETDLAKNQSTYAKARNGIQFTMEEVVNKPFISYTGSAEMEKRISKKCGVSIKRVLEKVKTKNDKEDTRVTGLIVDLVG